MIDNDKRGAQWNARGPEEAEFGAGLKAARTAARLTVKEVAVPAQISVSAVHSYEAGKMMPRPEVLRRLEEVLKVKLGGSNGGGPAEADQGKDSSFFAELAALYARHGATGAITVTVTFGG